MNFAIFLEMRARGRPDALAIVDRRVRLSYAAFDEAASRFANVLRDLGIGPGERLAIFLPNRAELAIALMGALKAGVIAAPLNWRLQGPDLDRVLLHCAPSCLLTTTEQAAKLGRHGFEMLEVTDEARGGSFWPALASARAEFVTLGRQGSDIANLLYTSGTTAVPKAAIHTHGMRASVAAAMADCFKLSSRDVGLAVSPMFHTSGMSVFSNAIFAGGACVLLDRWDLVEFLEAIEHECVTFMHLIATIIVDIARAPDDLFRRDFRTVRFTWGGGHSVNPEIFETFERRIGGVLLQGYSRTEGGLTYNPLDREQRRFDRHGFPNRNSSELAVLDLATGLPCRANEMGEIAFAGDGVSPGYWDGDYVRARPTTRGGFQPTGDLGFLDDDGALHFLGRQDNMIKSGGENVYPAEVSRVLLEMPEIADAVVLDLPDERLGQRVGALIVPALPGLTVEQVQSTCRHALAGFKIPRTIRFTDALPRLGSQKVDIEACRRMLVDAQEETEG